MTATVDGSRSGDRAGWRAVAIPREHGGWGLTLEPVLLGLLVAWSWSGLALGIAAFGLFLVRTPAKLAAVDRRRGQWRARSRLALTIASVELAVVATLAVAALAAAGGRWLIPVAVAAPLVAVELWYDVRSRSRRLVPELCGAVGVAASSAAVVLAAGDDRSLAFAAWLVLAARSIGSIPFVRAQIALAHRGVGVTRGSDLAQLAALAGAAGAVAVDERTWLGALAVAATVVAQAWWSRRQPPAIKVVGFRQMGLGLAVVVATALGVWLA